MSVLVHELPQKNRPSLAFRINQNLENVNRKSGIHHIFDRYHNVHEKKLCEITNSEKEERKCARANPALQNMSPLV